MSWLIGAGLGLLRGGPLGAVVGGAMQYFITKSVRGKIKRNLPGIVDESSFVACLVVTLTKVAMTKGSVSSSDVALIHKFFIKNLDYQAVINSRIDDIEIPPSLEENLILEVYKTREFRNIITQKFVITADVLGQFRIINEVNSTVIEILEVELGKSPEIGNDRGNG